MSNVRLPLAVCAAVAEVLKGSHATLDALFEAAGVPGPPPDLAHHSKWKTWLFRAGNDPAVDSLAILGNLIEEFMDLPPNSATGADTLAAYLDDNYDPLAEYHQQRERLVGVLETFGFRYYRGGRVLPIDEAPYSPAVTSKPITQLEPAKPSTVEALLETLIRGLPRAMHPLIHRRKGATTLSFDSEYDIQDLLHSQLRPWIADIRPEEYTPSYAGSSTRMDFLFRAHRLVIETKRIRTAQHAQKLGDELIIDIDHYQRHPDCDRLWCVIYDPQHLIPNPSGLIADLEGQRTRPDGSISVRVFVIYG